MKLREGGYYRRRDGQITGPVQFRAPGSANIGWYPFESGISTYAESGETVIGDTSRLDLIEEVPAPGSEKPAKRALQVGDRVRVFHRIEFKGEVIGITKAGWVQVMEDGFYSAHDESPFHPKQCRRLVKRERRRVWVDPARTICEGDPFSFSPIEGWVEFVEVRKK